MFKENRVSALVSGLGIFITLGRNLLLLRNFFEFKSKRLRDYRSGGYKCLCLFMYNVKHFYKFINCNIFKTAIIEKLVERVILNMESNC